jgi:hypothetical protein
VGWPLSLKILSITEPAASAVTPRKSEVTLTISSAL